MEPISTQNGKYCPSCGYLNPSWRSECEQCQARLGLLGSQPIAGQNGILCPSCGYLNPSWRSECEQCRVNLKSPNRSAYTSGHDRPGCVTAYAILLGVTGGIVGIGGLFGGCSLIGDSRNGDGALGLLIIVCGGGAAILNFLLAKGLWDLKNWARITLIVLQSLGILGNLIRMCGFLSDPSNYSGIEMFGAIIGTAISGYIIYWFADNSGYFT
jgi:hypothetical protein